MCLNTEVSMGLHLWAYFFIEGYLLMNSSILGNAMCNKQILCCVTFVICEFVCGV